jgi:hypothetical protein
MSDKEQIEQLQEVVVAQEKEIIELKQMMIHIGGLIHLLKVANEDHLNITKMVTERMRVIELKTGVLN